MINVHELRHIMYFQVCCAAYGNLSHTHTQREGERERETHTHIQRETER